LVAAALGGVLALSLSACGGASAEKVGSSLEDMEPLTLTYNEQAQTREGRNEHFGHFIDYVEEKSNGKIKFEVYYSSALFSQDESLDGISTGVADMTLLTPSYFPNDLPVTNWFTGLASLSEVSWPYGLMQEMGAVGNLFTGNEDLQAEYDRHNVKVLSATTTARADLMCTKPVKTLKDLKGKRVRVSGPTWQHEFEHLGATAVFLAVDETYEGLQRGTIDCAAIAGGLGGAYTDFGITEVAPHYTPISASSVPGIVQLINKDTWDKLPADAQQVLQDAASTYAAEYVKYGFVDGAAKHIDTLKKHGGSLNEPDEIQSALTPFQEKVVKSLEGKAPSEVGDPAGFVEQYRGLLADWSTRLDELGVEKEPTPRTLTSITEAFKNAPEAVDWDAYVAQMIEAGKAS